MRDHDKDDWVGVALRMPAWEREKINKAAGMAKMSVNSWLRRLADKAADELFEEKKKKSA